MNILLAVLLLPWLNVQSSQASSAWTYDDLLKWPESCQNNERNQRQSPIDIKSFVSYDPTPFVFKNYGFINTSQENNGHTLKVVLLHQEKEDETKGKEEAEEGWEAEAAEDLRPQVSGGGLPGTYVLDSFHFHWGSDSLRGSEHILQGCSFAGEMHLVHYKKEYGSVAEALKHSNGLAVLGIWLSPSHAKTHHSTHLDVRLAASKASYYFAPDSVPMHGACGYTREDHELSSHHWYDMITPHDNAENKGPQAVNLRQMMPFETKKFYRYEGSLTTPPCTENVIWSIFEETVSVPEEFLKGLRLLGNPHDPTHHISDNFRPTQSLSGRSVFYSGDASGPHETCKQSHDLHETCAAFPMMHFMSVSDNDVETETENESEENCPAGHLPSPINLYLSQAQPLYSPHLQWKHIGSCKGVKVVNDGYVLKVLYPSAFPEWELIGSNLTSPYYLIGIQLRWGSEHHLGGLSFPLEIQLVHYNSKYKNFQDALKKTDGVVVVSKFFQEPVGVDTTLDAIEGHPLGHNKQLSGIIYAVQRRAQKPLGAMTMRSPNIQHLMGDTSTYYEYQGAIGPLTRNTCPSITATWMVIRKTGHISRSQLDSLRAMRSADGSTVTSNNRPLAYSDNRQVILRINSRELTHEYETMLKRAKRSPPMKPPSPPSPPQSFLSRSSSSLSSSPSQTSIIVSVSVVMMLMVRQFGR